MYKGPETKTFETQTPISLQRRRQFGENVHAALDINLFLNEELPQEPECYIVESNERNAIDMKDGQETHLSTAELTGETVAMIFATTESGVNKVYLQSFDHQNESKSVSCLNDFIYQDIPKNAKINQFIIMRPQEFAIPTDEISLSDQLLSSVKDRVGKKTELDYKLYEYDPERNDGNVSHLSVNHSIDNRIQVNVDGAVVNII